MLQAADTRKRLPNRRNALTLDIYHAGHIFTASISRFDDGRIAELFLSSAKTGTGIERISYDAAIIISIALQTGVSIEALRHSVKRDANGSALSLIGATLDMLSALEAEART